MLRFTFTIFIMMIVTGVGVRPSSAAQNTSTAICGSAASPATTRPLNSLCASGDSSPVQGSGPWQWQCVPLDGGASVTCTAPYLDTLQKSGIAEPAQVDGLASGPIGQHQETTTSSVTPDTGGPSAPSSASHYFAVPFGQHQLLPNSSLAGTCGPANTASLSTVPVVSSLCASGVPTLVLGTGPWTWSCLGVKGGANANCSAAYIPPPPPSLTGVCGVANLQANRTTAPSSPADLCIVGISSTVRGTGPWTWQCHGIAGGLESTCFAAPGGVALLNMEGANLLQIQTAIQNARNIFLTAPNTTVVLHFPAGVYNFSQDTSVDPSVYCLPPMVTETEDNCPQTQAIDMSNVNPGVEGRLILMGDGPALTTFVTNPDQAGFTGSHIYRASIVGIHQTLDRLTASQGHVVNPIGNPYPTNVVVVDTDPGFPTLQMYPLGLYNPGKSGHEAHYLRQFTSDGNVCHINWQSPTPRQSFDTVAYMPEAGHSNRYWLTLDVHSGPTNPYADGELIGIKSEAGEGNTYLFRIGSDIMFDDMLWTNRSRGAFESLGQVGGMTNVQIYDSSVRKNPPIGGEPVCMSGSGGGPQIGQPTDMPV